MPGGYSKRNALPPNPGLYRTRIFVYAPARGVSDEGGVIRDPSGVGQAPGGLAPTATRLWIDYAEVLPFGGSDRADAAREVSQQFWNVEIRWARNKIYVAGQMIFIPGTGETFQVDAAPVIETKYAKVILSCRRVA